MKTSTQAALTAAFEKGFATGRNSFRKDGIPASLPFKGSANHFFWAGFKKGRAALDAYEASPEYAAECKARAQEWSALNSAMREISRGNHETARTIMNEELGLKIS